MLGRHCPKFGVNRVVSAGAPPWGASQPLPGAPHLAPLPPQVAIPLPPPVGYLTTDEYRLQLSFEGAPAVGGWIRAPPRPAPPLGPPTTFRPWVRLRAGDRLLTPWMLVMGRRGVPVPYLEIELVRSGGQLVSVAAQVGGPKP